MKILEGWATACAWQERVLYLNYNGHGAVANVPHNS
jgi:hypothetical protein